MHRDGPLNDGTMKADIITCPWHGWKYSVKNGKSPHKGGDSISSHLYLSRMQGRYMLARFPKMLEKRYLNHIKHIKLLKEQSNSISQILQPQVLPVNASIRVLGISTTSMNDELTPQKSTSEAALEFALDYAKNNHNSETIMLRLRQLNFRHCEGYYSKNPKACIFSCSISEMVDKDQIIEIYNRAII